MMLVTHSRLSVQPVTQQEWDAVLALSNCGQDVQGGE